MRLQEFQQMMKSDAAERCKELEERLKSRNSQIAKQEDMLRVLFNRCYALTATEMCWFCDLREDCHKSRSMYLGKENSVLEGFAGIKS